MSDTQSKIEQRRKEAQQRKQQNRKRETAKIKYRTKQRIKAAAITVVACVLLAALILPSMGVTKRWVTAVKIGDTKISTAEYSYYYQTSFQNYYQTMVSYLGKDNVPINLSRSLSKQDMSEDQTYADYFSNNAIDQLTRLVVLASEAEKAGYTLPEEDQQQIGQLVEQLETTAANNNQKVDDYLSSNYGTGFNMDLFKAGVERELLAQSFQEYKTNEPQYSEEELESYFAENEQGFTTVDYRWQSFKVVEATEDSEGVTAEEAKQNADDFLVQVTDEKSFSEAALKRAKENAEEGEEAKDESLTEGASYSGISQVDVNLANWLFGDDVKAGDKTVLESADGKTYYAVYLVRSKERDETNTVDVRHILVRVSDMENEDAKKTGEDKAKDLLEQWKENGATEEAFAQLANDNSDDTGSNTNGGLYEQVQPGQMTTNFNDWCFDASRKAGDTDIVETTYGYHVMYYVGENIPTWQAKVESTMRTNAYNAYYNEVSAGYEVSTSWLGLYLRNEPI